MTEPQAMDPLWSFYRACGVTVHLGETPHDRFAEPDATAPAAAQVRPPAPVPTAVAAGDAEPAGPAAEPQDADALADARAAARSAVSLEALHRALAAYDGCPLKHTARSTCFGEGPVGAALMVVGEAPGREEDEAGRPFVGRSGRLLEKMLAAIGLARGEVFISNVIAWRPPGNRTPSPIETATCEVFVRREIALVRPKILVPLGGPAAKVLLRTEVGIVRQRGRWTRYEDGDIAIAALPMFHPAYLLRSPAEKRRAWSDLLAVRERLERG